MEDLDFYTKIRNGYLDLASRDLRIRVVPADRSIEVVHRDVLRILGLDSSGCQ